jgi:hypothetical protein
MIGGIQEFADDVPLSHWNMLVCIQVAPLFQVAPFFTATLDRLDGARDPPGPGRRSSTVSNETPASPADSQATLRYSVPASPADSQATLRYSVPASPADSQATLRCSVPASPADSQATLRCSVPASPADSQATLRCSVPASPAEALQYPGLPENPDSLCFESKEMSISESPSRRVRRRICYA